MRATTGDEIVARTLALPIGEIGLAALRDRHGSAWDLSEFLRAAIYYYLADKPSGRAGWPVPRFLTPTGATAPVDVTIAVTASAWTSAEEVARAQGVELGGLVHHAALYFAAHVDAGRVTQRIVDDLYGS